MIEKTIFEGLYIVNQKRNIDERGYFVEAFKKKDFEKNGINIDFVQDNHSYSKSSYTLRGLHLQMPPMDQAKLVKVIKGSIVDIALDLRPSSSTYKKYFKIKLTDSNDKQLFIPTGFAHGFLTLENNTEVIYKTSNYYNKDKELGILWSDTDLKIKWHDASFKPIISEKDKINPTLKSLEKFFEQFK